MKTKRFRVLSTQDLRDINAQAVERGYNRSLTDRFFEDVDPSGKHVVSFEMPHEHAAGVRVEPHQRWAVLAKMRTTDEPVPVQVDVAPGLETLGITVEREV